VTRFGIAFAIAAVVLAPAGAQQPPTFRVATDLVSIYATVTDRSGRLVTDLTRDDFEVRDNGRRQTLSVFSNDLQPFSAVVMIDRSGSMTTNFELVRQAAATFVAHLLEGDRLRIGNFSQDIVLSPATFTDDRALLLEILREELQDAGGSPVWEAIDRSIIALSSEPGRRVVLVFSDGDNTGSSDRPSVNVKDLIRRAEEHDVMVYAIGFSIVETHRVTSPVFPRPRPPTTRPRPFPPGGALPFGQWGSPVLTRTTTRPPHPGLEQLASASGGGYFAMSTSTGLETIFARVAEELHRQYWLGFTPGTRDGRVHRLDVRVRRSGLTVRARRDYLAAAN
jgi:Ca-activated chloride channel family protein